MQAVAATILGEEEDDRLLKERIRNQRRNDRSETIERQRRHVTEVFYKLGARLKYYLRMSEASFWHLHEILQGEIVKAMTVLNDLKKGRTLSNVERNERQQFASPFNGFVPTETRLGCALQYFAGGKADDICLVFGVSRTSFFESVWSVVGAINKTRSLDIVFPSNHDK
jgi:hypothetical protein